jgi:hypothetical protein
MWYEWTLYLSVAERQAAQDMRRLRKNGHPVSPVLIEGRESRCGKRTSKAPVK